MTIVTPQLQEIRPAKWLRPTFRDRVQILVPGLIAVTACLYVGIVILLPAVAVIVEAFAKGLAPFLESFESEDMMSALRLTLLDAAIVVPANCIFGLSRLAKIFRGWAVDNFDVS